MSISIGDVFIEFGQTSAHVLRIEKFLGFNMILAMDIYNRTSSMYKDYLEDEFISVLAIHMDFETL